MVKLIEALLGEDHGKELESNGGDMADTSPNENANLNGDSEYSCFKE